MTCTRQALEDTLSAHPKVTATKILDDVYFMGPLEDVLQAIDDYADRIRPLQLTLQHRKSAILHASSLHPDAKQPSQEARENMTMTCGAYGIPLLEGILAAGTPIGTPRFVQNSIKTKTEELICHTQRVADAIEIVLKNPNSPAHLIPDIYKLIRWCLAPAMISYWLRTLPHAVTKSHAELYDTHVYHLILKLMDVPECPLYNALSPLGELVKNRVNLHAASGGLGITSAATIANDARLGSLVMVAAHVGAALGENFDAEKDGLIAMPELYSYLLDPNVTELHLPALEGVPPSYFFHGDPEKCRKVTARLTAARKNERLEKTLALIQNPADKAFLLSCGEEGAYPLMVNPRTLPRGVTGLNNLQFQALMRWRSGLPPPGSPIDDPISHLPEDTGERCHRQGCGQPVTANGLHNLICRENGEGGRLGQQTTRHHRVKYAFQMGVKAIGRGRGVGVRDEPLLDMVWPRKNPGPIPGSQEDPKGDALITGLPRQAGPVVVDITVSSAFAPSNLRLCKSDTTAAAAAGHGYDSKIKKYNAAFQIPADCFWPISMETGGRMDARSRAHITELVKTNLGYGPEEKIPPHLIGEYNRHLRTLLDTLAVSLAKGVADTLLTRWERRVPARKGKANISPCTPSSPDEDMQGG